VASTKSGSHVRRYEQHPAADGDRWDGVTIQWFDSVEEFHASLREEDYQLIDEDTRKFLDVDRLEFVLTEEPHVVMP
jgi:hypothetical protein